MFVPIYFYQGGSLRQWRVEGCEIFQSYCLIVIVILAFIVIKFGKLRNIFASFSKLCNIFVPFGNLQNVNCIFVLVGLLLLPILSFLRQKESLKDKTAMSVYTKPGKPGK